MFKLVKTTQAHKVYLVSEGVVLHDTRGARTSQQSIIDATLEALNEEGSLSKQLDERLPGEGLMLQTQHLHHVKVASINPDFYVSSKAKLSPDQTRGIVTKFLKRKK